MGDLAVICIIFAVIGVVATLYCLIAAFVEDDGRDFLGFGTFFGVLTLLLIGGVYLFGSTYYHNHFNILYEEYQTSEANVGIMELKANALEDDLTALLNIYIGHEASLIDVVGERDIEGLRMLFERYPDLKAGNNVQQVTNEFIALVEDIATAKLVVNAVARAYNTSQRVIPAGWFAPWDLPASLTLLSVGD